MDNPYKNGLMAIHYESTILQIDHMPQLSQLSSFVRVGKKFLNSTFPKAPLHDFSDPPVMRRRKWWHRHWGWGSVHLIARIAVHPRKKELMEIWYTKFGPMPMWFIGTRMFLVLPSASVEDARWRRFETLGIARKSPLPTSVEHLASWMPMC